MRWSKNGQALAGCDVSHWWNSAQHEQAVEHIRRLQQDEQVVMIQPYMAGVDTEGETALVFLGGEFSHALSKGTILKGPDVGIDWRFQHQPYFNG